MRVQNRKTTGEDTNKHTGFSSGPNIAAASQVPVLASDARGRNVGGGGQQTRATLQHKFSPGTCGGDILCSFKPRSPASGFGRTAEAVFGSEP